MSILDFSAVEAVSTVFLTLGIYAINIYVFAAVAFVLALFAGYFVEPSSSDDEFTVMGWFVPAVLSLTILAGANTMFSLGIPEASTSIVQVLIYFAIYLLIGLAYSFAKWYRFTQRIAERFKVAKAKAIEEYGDYILTYELPRELSKDATKEEHRETTNFASAMANIASACGLSRQRHSTPKTMAELLAKIKPQVANNKNIVSRWIAFWPTSLLFTFIDPLSFILDNMMVASKKVYNSITESNFKDL